MVEVCAAEKGRVRGVKGGKWWDRRRRRGRKDGKMDSARMTIEKRRIETDNGLRECSNLIQFVV